MAHDRQHDDDDGDYCYLVSIAIYMCSVCCCCCCSINSYVSRHTFLTFQFHLLKLFSKKLLYDFNRLPDRWLGQNSRRPQSLANYLVHVAESDVCFGCCLLAKGYDLPLLICTHTHPNTAHRAQTRALAVNDINHKQLF